MPYLYAVQIFATRLLVTATRAYARKPTAIKMDRFYQFQGMHSGKSFSSVCDEVCAYNLLLYVSIFIYIYIFFLLLFSLMRKVQDAAADFFSWAMLRPPSCAVSHVWASKQAMVVVEQDRQALEPM